MKGDGCYQHTIQAGQGYVPRPFGKSAGVNGKKNGAGNESRTRDLHLGKVALYQLSYSRSRCCLRSNGYYGLGYFFILP